MIAGFAYDDGTMMGMSMVTDRYNASFRSRRSLFALVEPILRLAEELASRTVSGRLRRRLSEERKANTLLIDVQVCALSSSLPRQINCCFNHFFFLFHLFLISPCSEIECSNFSSLPVLLSSCHNLTPTTPPTPPPPISSFRSFLVLQNYIF